MWLEIPAADIIMFLVDVYCAASDSAEHGRMTTAQLANYRQFKIGSTYRNVHSSRCAPPRGLCSITEAIVVSRSCVSQMIDVDTSAIYRHMGDTSG